MNCCEDPDLGRGDVDGEEGDSVDPKSMCLCGCALFSVAASSVPISSKSR